MKKLSSAYSPVTKRKVEVPVVNDVIVVREISCSVVLIMMM